VVVEDDGAAKDLLQSGLRQRVTFVPLNKVRPGLGV
jgi:hypothetical protein